MTVQVPTQPPPPVNYLPEEHYWSLDQILSELGSYLDADELIERVVEQGKVFEVEVERGNIYWVGYGKQRPEGSAKWTVFTECENQIVPLKAPKPQLCPH